MIRGEDMDKPQDSLNIMSDEYRFADQEVMLKVLDRAVPIFQCWNGSSECPWDSEA